MTCSYLGYVENEIGNPRRGKALAGNGMTMLKVDNWTISSICLFARTAYFIHLGRNWINNLTLKKVQITVTVNSANNVSHR